MYVYIYIYIYIAYIYIVTVCIFISSSSSSSSSSSLPKKKAQKNSSPAAGETPDPANAPEALRGWSSAQARLLYRYTCKMFASPAENPSSLPPSPVPVAFPSTPPLSIGIPGPNCSPTVWHSTEWVSLCLSLFVSLSREPTALDAPCFCAHNPGCNLPFPPSSTFVLSSIATSPIMFSS